MCPVSGDRTSARQSVDGRPYHHGDLRNALIAEAVLVVEERGIEGLNLREIARRVGVSHAASYHHFVDKSALMTAITEQAFTLLSAALSPCPALPGSAVDRLVALGVTYVRFAAEHRGYFLVMWRPELRDSGREDAVVAAGRPAYDIIRAGVEACHHEAGDVPYQPKLMTFGAWSMAHGIASLVTDGPLERLFPSLEAVTELATTLIRATAESIYGPRRPAPSG
jgi:AcrR family transcriptional regulator